MPEIDPDHCLLNADVFAECTLCQDACPHGAIIQDEDSLGIDTGACTGCGLCQPACPQGAVSAMPDLPKDGRRVLAVCNEAAVPGRATLPCIHAIDLAALARWHAGGTRAVEIHTGECDGCPYGRFARFEATLRLFNRMMESRGLPVLRADHPDSVSSSWQGRSAGDEPDRQRRRLLLGLAGQDARASGARREALTALLAGGGREEGAAPLWNAIPTIDPGTCVGCDMCVRVCMDGAVTLERGVDGTLAYHVRPEACTGCGLCATYCDTGAMTILRHETGTTSRIALEMFTCAACGADFHQPCTHASNSRLCPTCRKTRHHSKLFQVMP